MIGPVHILADRLGASLAALLLCAALALGWAQPPAGRDDARGVRSGVFLLARQGMPDPNFHETVVLVTQHDRGGTLGIVVNRPSSVELKRFFPEVDGLKRSPDRLYVGGPVSHQTLVFLLRAEKQPAHSLRVMGDLYLSADLALLAELLGRGHPTRGLRVYTGHAGWAEGQLEAELTRGDWHVVPAESEAVFSDEPEKLWRKLVDGFRGQWVEHRALPRL